MKTALKPARSANADVQRLDWIASHPRAEGLRELARAAAEAIQKYPPSTGQASELQRIVVDSIQRALISLLRYQRSRGPHFEFCSVCGCMEDYACPGGCAWAFHPSSRSICTVCAKRMQELEP